MNASNKPSNVMFNKIKKIFERFSIFQKKKDKIHNDIQTFRTQIHKKKDLKEIEEIRNKIDTQL